MFNPENLTSPVKVCVPFNSGRLLVGVYAVSFDELSVDKTDEAVTDGTATVPSSAVRMEVRVGVPASTFFMPVSARHEV
jgi:hypothetical protein